MPPPLTATGVDAAIWNAAAYPRHERDHLRSIHRLASLVPLRDFLNQQHSGSGVLTGRITSIWVDKHPQVTDPCCINAQSTELADLAIVIRRSRAQRPTTVRMWLLQGKLLSAGFASSASQKQVALYECTSGAPAALNVRTGNAVKPTGVELGTFNLRKRFGNTHLLQGEPYFWSYLIIGDKQTAGQIWHQWPAMKTPTTTPTTTSFTHGIFEMSKHLDDPTSTEFGANWRGKRDHWRLLGEKLVTSTSNRASTLAGGRWQHGVSLFASRKVIRDIEGGGVSVASTGVRNSWDERPPLPGAFDIQHEPRDHKRQAVSLIVIDQVQTQP